MDKASAEQLKNWLLKLDAFKTEGPGTTRLALSPEEMRARDWIKGEMTALGLKVSEDGAGNICGRLKGTDPSLAAVWTGSHIDTVCEGGMFDGAAGVFAAMEAARLISKAKLPHKRDICVRIYTSEESARFGMGCIGSRALAGHLKRDDLSGITGSDGISLESLLKDGGFPVDEFEKIPVKKGDVYASVELHIEQSPSLEKNNKTIGIVDAICAPSNSVITITGQQSHAGGTSMADRKDAFMAAAEIALALEESAKQALSAYTTGTVGYADVSPNTVNVIPGRAVISIDIRDCDFASKTYVTENFLKKAKAIAARRSVSMEVEEKSNDVPMKCDGKIRDIIEKACKDQGVSYMHTVSGAYHDSLFIGEFAPVGMIFVPSKGGISHSPAEWTEYEDIAAGTDILVRTLLELAQ